MQATEYRVVDRQGSPVRKGDPVTDFRGDSGTFTGVSRGPEGGRTAKVIVDGAEYYASVWGLTVEAAEAGQ
jgi:hypothetical protein